MASDLKRQLDRWLVAGLIDAAAVERVLDFESRTSRTSRFRWPVALILGFGALLIGAGVLLFVSANWEALSPLQRMSLVVALVAGFHVAGAACANSSGALATTFHALGTIALGAGIALTGQIFNLEENWPSGVLLWAAGAAFGYLLMRDWPQLSMTAILVPWWLCSEWLGRHPQETPNAALSFLLLLAFTYLTALRPGRVSDERRALCALGSISLLPFGMLTAAVPLLNRRPPPPADPTTWVLWALAFLLPLGLAVLLRGRLAWMNGLAAVWVAILALLANQHWGLLVHIWCALGAIALTAWGVHEMRSERINLGIVGFAVTVLFYYFSSVMDKLGRSVSLIGLGVLFLAGGWALEKGRRRLIAQIHGGPAVSRFSKGMLLALVQVGLVLCVAAKYYSDRASLPRVWVHAAPYDPNLPIRGRYIRLRVQLESRKPEGVAFFLPEHAPDPSRLFPGEELWAEVSVPSAGPPRPIRLGVKKNGVLRPLD